MTDISIGGDIKKLESNCSKKLSGFVSKLNQHANNLRKHSMELKQIAGDLMVKSQQLQKLENIKWVFRRNFVKKNLNNYILDLSNFSFTWIELILLKFSLKKFHLDRIVCDVIQPTKETEFWQRFCTEWMKKSSLPID